MKHVLIFLTLLSLSLAQVQAQTFPNYIAHGGGAIGSCTYSNSREALMQSIERGYTFIEIDIDTTIEGVLVASHDWESFHKNAGHPEYGDKMLSLDEFKATTIYGQYTPITIDEIVEILYEYPSVCLVTDKISEVEILDRSLSPIRERVYVEAFSIEDFIDLRKAGYHPMYSHRIVDLAAVIVENLLNGEARIDFIVNSTSDSFTEIKRIKCLMPFKIAMFTSNSMDFFDEHLGTDIDLVYTDYYNPSTGRVE